MTDDEFDAAVAHFRERLKLAAERRRKDMTAPGYTPARDAMTRPVLPKHFADTEKDDEGEP